MTKVVELTDVRERLLASRRAKMVLTLMQLERALDRVPTLVEFATSWKRRTAHGAAPIANNKAAAMIASWWGLHCGRGRYALATRALYRQAHLRKRRVGRQTTKSLTRKAAA